MTTITFRTEGDRIVGFDSQGHSGYAEEGEDIVCAAISSITQFCISCARYCIDRLGFKTTDYTNWLSNVGSLSCLGYDGEELAIQLSRQSRGYKSDEDVLKTLKRLSDNQRNRQYLTRYFKMCKESLGKYWIQEIKKMYEQNNHTYKTDQINFDNHSLINL